MSQQYGLIAKKSLSHSEATSNNHCCNKPSIKPWFKPELGINSLYRCQDCNKVWAVGWELRWWNNNIWYKAWKRSSVEEWKRAGGAE